jgi:hypothetical protein
LNRSHFPFSYVETQFEHSPSEGGKTEEVAISRKYYWYMCLLQEKTEYYTLFLEFLILFLIPLTILTAHLQKKRNLATNLVLSQGNNHT